MSRDDSPVNQSTVSDAGELAFGIAFSVCLHGAALATALLFVSPSPPETIPVMTVELVDASTLRSEAAVENANTVRSVATRKDEPRVSEDAYEPKEPDKPKPPAPAKRLKAPAREVAAQAAAIQPEVPPSSSFEVPDSSSAPPSKNAAAREGEAVTKLSGIVPRPKPKPPVPMPRDGETRPNLEALPRVQNLETGNPAVVERLTKAAPSASRELGETAVVHETARDTTRLSSGRTSDAATHPNGHSMTPSASDKRTAPRLVGGGTANPKPRYPYVARRLGQEGRVLLLVHVGRSGVVQRISVNVSSGFRLLDEAAVEAVKKWRFAPATFAGIAVPGQIEVPITFNLTEG